MDNDTETYLDLEDEITSLYTLSELDIDQDITKIDAIFKNLLLLHNANIHGKPDYLAELVHPLPSPTKRSTNTHQLQLPDKYKLHSTNIRAWSISIPYYWNNLPLVIRSATVTSTFKSLLKTHLFQQAYPTMP